MSRNLHRRIVCAAVMVVLIPLGLVCRFVPIGLPQAVVKYGGSFLWATMVYLLVAVLLPELRPATAGTLAAIVAAVIEYVKLIPSAELDLVRSTFAGKVLLGRFFSLLDIAVYWIAILCAAGIDHRVSRRSRVSKR
ncbi:MAG: DUF2809 domain-containing protein [Gemmataceae bacterium]